MKCIFSFVLFILLSVSATFAQPVAGVLPVGGNLEVVNLLLTVSLSNEVDSASLDLDCDGQPDLSFILEKGFSAADLPTSAIVKSLHDSLGICGQYWWGSGIAKANQYILNEQLICLPSDLWVSGSRMILGDLGGLVSNPPFSANNAYLAFQHGSNVGWIRFSYNVDEGAGALFLSADEVTTFCPTVSIEEFGGLQTMNVYPNPSRGQFTLDFESTAKRDIRIYDLKGGLVHHSQSNEAKVNLDLNAQGVFQIMVLSDKGAYQARAIIE